MYLQTTGLNGRKEGNVLFNDALNTFNLRLCGVRCIVNGHSDGERGNLLPPHGYSFKLAERVLLYAPSDRQDSTYNGLSYTSHGALAGMRNSPMDPMKDQSNWLSATGLLGTAFMFVFWYQLQARAGF